MPFQDLLNHPAVQAGAAPFIVALVVALVLHRVRLGGLAAVAGFATAVGLIAGFAARTDDDRKEAAGFQAKMRAALARLRDATN